MTEEEKIARVMDIADCDRAMAINALELERWRVCEAAIRAMGDSFAKRNGG